VVVPEIPFSLSTPVREKLYQRDFLPVFHQKDSPALDWLYGPRANGKRPHTPRFNYFESCNTFKVFHPMVTSLPMNYDYGLVAAVEN
jgi:hypothetical protein